MSVSNLKLEKPHFLDEDFFKDCFEMKGWKIKKYEKYEDKVLFNPNFYPEEYILAYSSKAIIICDGLSVINYRGCEFNDSSTLVKKHGIEALSDYRNWDIKQEKEWLIKKLNGSWVHSFSKISGLKYRKKVRC